MEDDQKKWKATQKNEKNGRQPEKIKDEPINQNQPNWL